MGDQLPSRAIQNLIARAAKAPAVTGESARFKAWAERGPLTMILADTSASMAESAGRRTKFEILRDALDQVWADLPHVRLVSFNAIAKEVQSPSDIPQPDGGTALHLALKLACEAGPARTLVISDGRPDDTERALSQADQLSGSIDVIYCGPDDDTFAITFMNQLARRGGRVFVRDFSKHDLSGTLSLTVREALGLPGPTGNR